MTAKSVPGGKAWLHEPKLDGDRLQAAKRASTARPYRRIIGASAGRPGRASAGHPSTFPQCLMGEQCFPGPNGVPYFFRLLKAAFISQGCELAVYTFDLMHLNGQHLLPWR